MLNGLSNAHNVVVGLKDVYEMWREDPISAQVPRLYGTMTAAGWWRIERRRLNDGGWWRRSWNIVHGKCVWAGERPPMGPTGGGRWGEREREGERGRERENVREG